MGIIRHYCAPAEPRAFAIVEIGIDIPDLTELTCALSVCDSE